MTDNGTKILTFKLSSAFWACIDDSYTITQMYEEHENVRVSLKDKFSTCTFIYCKGKHNEAIRILHEGDEYMGVLWRKKDGRLGGKVEGERGLRKFIQILKMFQKSLSSGYIELEVEKNDQPPSQFIPLTEREQVIVADLKEGVPFPDIKEKLELNTSVTSKIRKSLIRKGVIEDSFDELQRVLP